MNFSDYNITEPPVTVPPIYTDFQSYWYFHIYILAFGYFSISFFTFFSALSIRSQYPGQSLMFIACILLMIFGLIRTGFLLLDAYGAQRRLPISFLTFLYSLGFPCITATIAMTIFSIAKHCLRTDPKSFIWLIVLLHFAFSVTAEIVAVNEISWRLFLQTVTAVFMLWPIGLALLLGNIRKSLRKIDKPKNPMIKKGVKLPIKRRRERRKLTDSYAQTSFVRRVAPKAKSKSCGTINDSSNGSQLTMPTSSVVSIDSLESWDHFSLQGSPRISPVLTRHLSMPSVTTGRKFWTQRFAFRKHFKLPSTPTISGRGRKLKGINWRHKKPDSDRGNSLEREVISGEDSDQIIHKDQDSTVINYFTSGPGIQNSLHGPGNSHVKSGPIVRSPNSVTHGPESQSITIKRVSLTKETKPLIAAKVWKFVRAHYFLMVFYLFFCGLYLYSVFRFPVDSSSQNTESAWDWFTFQSGLR